MTTVINMTYSRVLADVPIARRILLDGTNRIHNPKDSKKTPTTCKYFNM